MLAQIKIILLSICIISSCDTPKTKVQTSENIPDKVEVKSLEIEVGADQMSYYLPKLKGKNVALVVNQTSMTKEGHVVDILLKKGVQIQQLFAPEHGFRGKADAGEQIKNGRDVKTDLPIVSLYGKNKKPTARQLQGIDLVIFDIQDVGARFYTYISTMHYVMEACAENGVDFMVFDRPNPNGHYVDGPVLDPSFSSFVGMHAVPVVHGMTVGEYAQMINGEGWLKGGLTCNLEIIFCKNYTHKKAYHLPISPSPNLPNQRSIYLYPSLCFFEGTKMSVGRGTTRQFQVIGHPEYPSDEYQFTPISREGAKYPKHENKVCKGYDLSVLPISELKEKGQLNLSYLINSYQNFPKKDEFFLSNKFIDKLAGTNQLRQQIMDGKSEDEIRKSWATNLVKFKKVRKKYLIYPE